MTREQVISLLTQIKKIILGSESWLDSVHQPIEEAFSMAIEALAQPEPKWIPVSERLPDIHDEVLVTARGEVSIAWLYVDGKWRSNDMPQPMFKDITAWMPLPEPYKEDK